MAVIGLMCRAIPSRLRAQAQATRFMPITNDALAYTLTDAVLRRNGGLECPACHDSALTHQHLKGYGQIIGIVFKCHACGKKSELTMVRGEGRTIVGWSNVGEWHRQMNGN
jgi:hypothetical protein